MPAANPPAFRLLACDLDGTLMDDDLHISPRVRAALAAAQARGVHVTLATGRGFPVTLPFARALDISVPIICYQGGHIQHPHGGAPLYRATMDRQLVLEVIGLARAQGWQLVVYIEDDIYLEAFQRPVSFYREMLGDALNLVDDLAQVVRASDKEPAKFITVADLEVSDGIQETMSAHFDGRITVVRSHDLFVEGNPPGVNKGAALRRLAEHLGVPQSYVMAIGDQGNDVAMIQWAGLGVAMGSGSVAAQAVADWIAPPLAADGAAVAIERFILDGK